MDRGQKPRDGLLHHIKEAAMMSNSYLKKGTAYSVTFERRISVQKVELRGPQAEVSSLLGSCWGLEKITKLFQRMGKKLEILG